MDAQLDIHFLRDVFESIPLAMMILDKEGKIIMMNKSQEEQSKIKRENAIGTYFHETWYRVFEQYDFSTEYFRLLRKGTPYAFVFHDVIPQFHDLKVSGRALGAPLSSGKGFILIHAVSEEIKRDKQELHQLNIQLSNSLNFLNNLLDSSPNSVITTDKYGFINLVNKTSVKQFGFSKGEFLWRNISNILEGAPSLKDLMNIAGEAETIDINCIVKGGQSFPARIQLTDITSDSEESYSKLFIIKDQTHEVSMERSLAERLEFEKMLSELYAAFVTLPLIEIDSKINKVLDRIGTFFGIERFYLSQFSVNANAFYITHSWSKKGVDPFPTKLSSAEFPWIYKQLRGKKDVSFKDPLDLPLEASIDKEHFLEQQTRFHLSIPLVVGDSMLGALCIEQVKESRTWSQELLQRLKIVSEAFVNVLLRKRSEESLQQAFSEIKRLKDRREVERNYLREEIKLEHNFENIIGNSKEIQSVLQKVEQVAPTNTTVLIQGETGTGKELIARAIHDASQLKNQPLIKVDCASLPSALIESELFGHEKGAFTGAHTQRIGRFELANGGTLFLDEIGELPFDLQGKLLRVIEEGTFERVGSSSTIKVDIRFIAATNRRLEEEAKEGRFRKDLLYRLNVFPIIIPPLRERKNDIRLLVNWLVDKFSKKVGRSIQSISLDAIKSLELYHWPGNVRELENVIERSLINSKGPEFFLKNIPTEANYEIFSKSRQKTLYEVERDHILRVLEDKYWKIEGPKGAADALGLHPSTLRGRIRKFGLHDPRKQ